MQHPGRPQKWRNSLNTGSLRSATVGAGGHHALGRVGLYLVVFFFLFGAGFIVFSPAADITGFLIYNAVLVILLTAVCYAKGEPPG